MENTCTQCTKPICDTNLDLEGSGFFSIAGILELVNWTLINGIPLLAKRGEGEINREKKAENIDKNLQGPELRKQSCYKGEHEGTLLYVGVNTSSVARLQIVQNAAARINWYT